MLRADGENGQVEFDGAVVHILRGGMKAKFNNRGSNVAETRIPVESLTAVNFKAATLTKPGHIEFSVPGISGPNGTVLFFRKSADQFEALREAVEAACRDQRRSPMASAAVDLVGQLTQLAKLRDDGARKS